MAVGGDAWSEVNPYMVELASELGVSFDNSSYTGTGPSSSSFCIPLTGP